MLRGTGDSRRAIHQPPAKNCCTGRAAVARELDRRPCSPPSSPLPTSLPHPWSHLSRFTNFGRERGRGATASQPSTAPPGEQRRRPCSPWPGRRRPAWLARSPLPYLTVPATAALPRPAAAASLPGRRGPARPPPPCHHRPLVPVLASTCLHPRLLHTASSAAKRHGEPRTSLPTPVAKAAANEREGELGRGGGTLR